jgi:inner membrane protein
MASLGHIAIGMAAARIAADGQRPSFRAMAAWSALSMLPDADVVGFSFGIAYADAWGHRGASHSFVFAAIAGAVAGALAPRLRLRPLRTWLLATAVVASHPLLDILTNGGLGCALFWPFDLARYFAPWQPIPVSPIGLAFLSPYGAFVATVELLLFSPALMFALRTPTASPRRAMGALLLISATLAWLLGSTDPVRQRLVGWLVDERTEYAAGFSEQALASVATQMDRSDVERLLGPPLESWWYYADTAHDCRIVRFHEGVVSRWRHFDLCTPSTVALGMSPDAVRSVAGSPAVWCMDYSRARGGWMFQARRVCFERGVVAAVHRLWLPLQP